MKLEILEDRTLPSATMPVSIAASGSTMGDGSSSTNQSAISANGQYEVFTSSADDLLAPGGPTINSGSVNIYRRDLVNGTTSLVSVDSAGTAGVGTGSSCELPTITADGRYVAFHSDATDLTSDGSGGVFVRDMTQGNTYLVNTNFVNYAGYNIAIGESNGQLAIAYTGLSNNNEQVYVSTLQLDGSGDIQSGSLTTTLVSADSSGNGGNNTSNLPVLSKDGSTLTFNSFAANLNVPGGYYDDNFNSADNLFLYSLSSQTLKLLSAEPTTGTNATGNESSAMTALDLPGAPIQNPQTVSADGRYVVFGSGSDNLVAGLNAFDTNNVFRRDLKTGTTEMVDINSAGTGQGNNGALSPVITPDGRYVAFASNSTNLTSDGAGGIFVRDMTQGKTYLVSSPAVANSVTTFEGGPSIAENSNGQLVIAYLVNDTSGNSQVYVSTLDIQSSTVTTTLISANSSGNGGNGASYLPLLSKDGNTVAFVSDATNLNGETGNNGNPLLFSYNLSTGILSQVSPAFATDTSVADTSISISDHGDISYALNGSSGAGLYAWNASTKTSTNIPLVLYPNDPSHLGFEFNNIAQTAISGDGSTVAFEEFDVLGQGYIYAASNWQSGTPTDTEISPRLGSALNGDTVFSAGGPSISDNGQVISYVLNYTQSNTNEVFVYNNGTTTAASAASSGGDANGNAGPATVSNDGSTVVFDSVASNLIPSTYYYFTPGQNQVYAYAVADNTTSLVSAKAPGLIAVDADSTDDLYSASLSDTGRYVAFWSSANDLTGVSDGYNAYAVDVQQGAVTLISGFGPDNSGDLNIQGVVVSGDGSTVAYANYGAGQIFSRNWLASSPTTTLVSVNSSGNGGGNGVAQDPSISDNGQIIAFDSTATNLTANDPNATDSTQIFIRNLATNTTTLASSNSSGTDGGNGNSDTPALDAAGNVVAYNSKATDLVAGVTVPEPDPNSRAENVYAFGTPAAENAASVSTVSVQWGTSGSAQLFTASDGLRLLPQGRKTDLPWLNIQQITINLSQPALLSASDVHVSGVNGTNYGPVTVTELSLTSYVIKLANPIAKADRVTVTISNAGITTFTRRLDVLPGDFTDDGGVSSADLFDVYLLYRQMVYNVFADFYGLGKITFADVELIRALIGAQLPPLPPPS